MQTSHAPTQGQEGVRAVRPAGEEQARRAKFADELQWMMHAGNQLSAACDASSDDDEDMVTRSSDIGPTLPRGSSVGTRSSSEEEAEDDALEVRSWYTLLHRSARHALAAAPITDRPAPPVAPPPGHTTGYRSPAGG